MLNSSRFVCCIREAFLSPLSVRLRSTFIGGISYANFSFVDFTIGVFPNIVKTVFVSSLCWCFCYWRTLWSLCCHDFLSPALSFIFFYFFEYNLANLITKGSPLQPFALFSLCVMLNQAIESH